MPQVMVNVLGIDQDAFPAFANFVIADVFGVLHSFSEKIPVIGIEVDTVPYSAWIDCVVLEEKGISILISTGKPHGVESNKGQCEFEMPIESFRFN